MPVLSPPNLTSFICEMGLPASPVGPPVWDVTWGNSLYRLKVWTPGEFSKKKPCSQASGDSTSYFMWQSPWSSEDQEMDEELSRADLKKEEGGREKKANQQNLYCPLNHNGRFQGLGRVAQLCWREMSDAGTRKASLTGAGFLTSPCLLSSSCHSWLTAWLKAQRRTTEYIWGPDLPIWQAYISCQQAN